MKNFRGWLNKLRPGKKESTPSAEQPTMLKKPLDVTFDSLGARSELDTRADEYRDAARPKVQDCFVCRVTLPSQSPVEEKEVQTIAVLDTQGRLIRELVRSQPHERLSTFAVSPNKYWVTYTCYVKRIEGEYAFPQIRMVSTDGRYHGELTRWDAQFQPCYLNPVFSPDGKLLVCQHALRGEWNPDLQLLRLVDTGQALAALLEGIIVNPLHIGNHVPVFMPDSKRIVYFGNFDYADALEICIFDPDYPKSHNFVGFFEGNRLTSGADGVWHRPRAIAIQPEWDQIFFIRGHMMPNEEISVIMQSDVPSELVIKNFISISGKYSHIGGLQVSCDGLWLTFDADRSIFIIQTNGTKLRKISPDGMRCGRPFFSPTGKRVAFLNEGNLSTCDLNGSSYTKLSNPAFTVEDFVWV